MMVGDAVGADVGRAVGDVGHLRNSSPVVGDSVGDVVGESVGRVVGASDARVWLGCMSTTAQANSAAAIAGRTMTRHRLGNHDRRPPAQPFVYQSVASKSRGCERCHCKFVLSAS
jgi:Flp pilus assembly secretin CpaC